MHGVLSPGPAGRHAGGGGAQVLLPLRTPPPCSVSPRGREPWVSALHGSLREGGGRAFPSSPKPGPHVLPPGDGEAQALNPSQPLPADKGPGARASPAPWSRAASSRPARGGLGALVRPGGGPVSSPASLRPSPHTQPRGVPGPASCHNLLRGRAGFSLLGVQVGAQRGWALWHPQSSGTS